MGTDQLEVVVVGNGPVGLTLANVLVNHGVRCRVLSKEPEQRPVWESRAEGVHVRTVALLARLGLYERAAAEGRPAHGFTLHSKQEIIARIPLDVPGSLYPGALILEQGKIERMLADRIVSRGVEVERGCELVDVQQDGQQVVSTFRRGAETEEIRSLYLIGCDGAHSATRHLLKTDFAGEPHPGAYALADAELEWHQEPLDEDLHVFMSSLLIFGRLAEGSWKIAALG